MYQIRCFRTVCVLTRGRNARRTTRTRPPCSPASVAAPGRRSAAADQSRSPGGSPCPDQPARLALDHQFRHASLNWCHSALWPVLDHVRRQSGRYGASTASTRSTPLPGPGLVSARIRSTLAGTRPSARPAVPPAAGTRSSTLACARRFGPPSESGRASSCRLTSRSRSRFRAPPSGTARRPRSRDVHAGSSPMPRAGPGAAWRCGRAPTLPSDRRGAPGRGGGRA